MAGLAAIRDAVKTTLESTIASLTAYDTVPEASNLPAACVVPDTADFDIAMGRGTDTWTFDLYVLVSSADMDLAQDQLDGFVTGAGANSIRAVIYANQTLGLSQVNAHVSRMSEYGAKFRQSELDHVGAVLRLVVHTTGTA
jgi:hypothetical protein